MSLNFYSSQNRNTLISRLTLPSITHYASTHDIGRSDMGDTIIFKMTWKQFTDMVRSAMPAQKRYMDPRFVELQNSPSHTVALNIPLQDKPFLITPESEFNMVTPEAMHTPDHAGVTIVFKDASDKQSASEFIKLQSPDIEVADAPMAIVPAEGFTNGRGGKGFLGYLVAIVIIILLGYLAYRWWSKKDNGSVRSPA